jgi:hypothetical protein
VIDGEAGPAFDGVGLITFSPRGGHVAYVGRRGTPERGDPSARVVYDGVAGPPLDAVTQLAFSADGERFGYLARKGDAWRAVIDRRESPAYPGLRELVFSGDGRSAAWIVVAGDREYVAQDGLLIDKGTGGIRKGSLAFWPGRKSPSYVTVAPDGKRNLVVDDRAGPACDEISGPSVAPAGSHWGYSARRGKTWSVIVDGREMTEAAWAAAPVFGPGDRILLLVQRPEGLAVLVDGRAFIFDLVMEDTLLFGRDGKHWGCIAGDKRSRRFFFVIDGVRRKTLDMEEVTAVALSGPRTGNANLLREWVAAELAL